MRLYFTILQLIKILLTFIPYRPRQNSEFFAKFQLRHPKPFADTWNSLCLKCTRRSDGKVFAVKIECRSFAKPLQLISLQRCQGHPSIVQLIDVIQDQNYRYIVMEYLSGGHLDSRKKYTYKALSNIARQLIDGLLHIQQQGLAHCDIRPENVLFVNATGIKIKIIDFGSAMNMLGDQTTPLRYDIDYSPPDIVNGCAKRDLSEVHGGDVWSLGATLYAIACESVPFRHSLAEPQEQIVQRILECKYITRRSRWRKLVHPVKTVIENSLRLLPEHRASLVTLKSLLCARLPATPAPTLASVRFVASRLNQWLLNEQVAIVRLAHMPLSQRLRSRRLGRLFRRYHRMELVRLHILIHHPDQLLDMSFILHR